ncbi:MAG: L,D-transpeptidase [Muribaculaceae bacterium]|nr:L,D-transpeptidase [Muribaculaceae bacterium]
MIRHIINIIALLLIPLASHAACHVTDSVAPAGSAVPAPIKAPATSNDSIAEVDTTAATLQLPALPSKATKTAFIVISKLNLTLSVYDRNEQGDTILVAQFPCCMGKNKGNKMKRGDMRTPESPAGKPFKITMIQDASTWRHDFKDGRGNIKAYGHWFLRLLTPGHSGIGIHGSTNNEGTVPGRASEGCIRLLDKDIITLKKHFAYVGMPVIIQGETQRPLEWEERARQAATH